MPLTRDDIDAVSMLLYVEGDLAFSVLLTRGGLTQRLGSSEGLERGAVMVKGATDSCFENFMIALPETLLERGARLEDDGTDGPRHDWTFEFAGGADTLSYHISYHRGSASLPDEFADMVVRAEALTHSWYVAGVAEETGAPMPAPTESSRPPRTARAPDRAKAAGPGRATPAQPISAKKERIALAVFIDLLALSIPYSFVHWILIGEAERTGPWGGALMLFAIVEFVLLQIARWSPGYWLLGIWAPHGEKPRFDPARTGKESPALLAVGVGLCALGVGILTAWATYHVPVPYFGLAFPLWLSIPITMLGNLALMLSGGLVLRLDIRGVWLGAGLTVVMLLGSVIGWSAWPGFVETALGGPGGEGSPGPVSGLAPFLALAVVALLAAGLFESWKRLGAPSITRALSPQAPSASAR